MTTKSFSADAVNLFLGSPADALTGSMTILMKTNRYYTDGNLLKAGTSYTVTKAWGQIAVENSWAADSNNILPEQGSPVAVTGFTTSEVAAVQSLLSNTVDGAALVNSTGYHFAGIPDGHINTAVKWYDRSGMGNDASFQASITAAAAWANPGYCTIPDPVGTTALMALPPLNFDYAAGESLFIFWRGLATPEASDYPIMGDSGQNNATYAKGLAIFCKTTGKMALRLYDAAGTAYAGGDSASTVFSATVETSFAICLDGVSRSYCYWVNGVREAAFASNFLSFNGGASTDTVSGRTFKLGGSDIVTAATQWGVLQKVRQQHILRRAAGLGAPAGIDAMVLNLHRNPQRLVTAAEW